MALSTNSDTTTSLDRLDAYRLARQFFQLAHGLAPHGSGLGDQLRRASSSVVLCLAEGVGRTSKKDQARFFAMARGSALECLAILDLLAVAARNQARLSEARLVLVRVIQTTTGLHRRQSS
jgi:four helix bundle protein